MRVFNQTRAVPVIRQGRLANTFWLRLRGLMGAPPLQEGEGLVLAGEKSIHTFFMGFPIDVLYVDKAGKVIRADAHVVPYRIGPFVIRSAYVLELPSGAITSTGTRVGDQLKFEY